MASVLTTLNISASTQNNLTTNTIPHELNRRDLNGAEGTGQVITI